MGDPARVTAAEEWFKVLAELRLLRLLNSVRLDIEDEDEVEAVDSLIPEAGTMIGAFARLGLFGDDDQEKWKTTIEGMAREAAGQAAAADARRTATRYLDARLEELGDRIGAEEARSFSTALYALTTARLVGSRRSLEYRLQLYDRVQDAEALKAAYVGENENAVIIASSPGEDEIHGEGGFVERPLNGMSGEVPDWAAGWADFHGRDLLRVIPGPLPTRSGLTVIAAELYSDGVVFLWHFLRPADAPVEPPGAWGLPDEDPDRWAERDRLEAQFLGGDRIESLTDDAGASYRRLWGGFGEWSANRPRVSLGSTTFTPAIPTTAKRLILDVARERVELSI